MDSTVAQHITKTPEVCGGKPCIAGHRIRVQDIVVWHEMQGQSPAEIVANFPQLTLADVHAALAYYFDHQREIRDDLRQADITASAAQARHPSKLAQKLLDGSGGGDSISSG